MLSTSKLFRNPSAVSAPDPYFKYVPLLLETTTTNGQQNNTFLDSSTNNFTITRNGTPTQGSRTPYWPDGYWSNYFNGSTDYLTPASNAAFTLGTGDFTVEAWVYPNSATAIYGIIGLSDAGTAGSFILFYNVGSSGTFSSGKISFLNIGGTRATSTGNVPANTWTHIAVSRASGSLKIFINGALDSTTAFTDNSTKNVCAIGRPFTTLNQEYFPGYISNARIVKGVAVYTGAFTVPTTPLAATQSSGTNIAAITGTQTSLLTCQSNRFKDNSVANSGVGFAITVNGTPQVQAFQPFSPLDSYTTAAYGGSGYFNGSSDYLTGASSAALAPGTGQYTLEMWIYFNSLASNPNEIFRTSNDSTAGRLVLYYSSGSLQIVAAGGAGGTTASFTFVTGQWYHVAASRDASNNQRLFVNGVLLATATSTNNYTQNGFNLGRGGSGTNYVNGYVSDCRLVNGTAVYTATFTPPTAPLTAITNTSLLTNFTNAGIYDAAAQNNAITVGDAQASITLSKWPPASIKFDGVGDYLQLPTSDAFNIFNGTMTIEGWVYPTNLTGRSEHFLSFVVDVSNRVALYWSGTTLTFFTVTTAGGSGSRITSASFPQNTWTYVALTKSGSTFTLYVNGVSAGTSTTTVYPTTPMLLRVGTYDGTIAADNFTGYMQDIRITKGVARTITTPTAAFPTR